MRPWPLILMPLLAAGCNEQTAANLDPSAKIAPDEAIVVIGVQAPVRRLPRPRISMKWNRYNAKTGKMERDSAGTGFSMLCGGNPSVAQSVLWGALAVKKCSGGPIFSARPIKAGTYALRLVWTHGWPTTYLTYYGSKPGGIFGPREIMGTGGPKFVIRPGETIYIGTLVIEYFSAKGKFGFARVREIIRHDAAAKKYLSRHPGLAAKMVYRAPSR